MLSGHIMKSYLQGRKERKKQNLFPTEKLQVFILNINKHDTQKKKIRQIRNDTMELLGKDISKGGLRIKCITCVYSRPRNLKDLLQRAKFYQNKDHKALTYFHGSVVSDYQILAFFYNE